MRWISGALFALLLTAVLAAGHYYIWRKTVKATNPPRRLRRILTVAIIFLGALLPVAFILSRFAIQSFLSPLFFSGFFWMGVLFYLVLILALFDAGRGMNFLWTKFKFSTPLSQNRPPPAQGPGTKEPSTKEPSTKEPGTKEPGTKEPGIKEPGTKEPGTKEPGTKEPGSDKPVNKPAAKKAEKPDEKPADRPTEIPATKKTEKSADAPPDPDRRFFLARTAAIGATVGATSIGLFGVRSARLKMKTPTVEVKIPRLPAAFSGFRIAVLSDVHLGPTLKRDFAKRVVALTQKHDPDLIAIVGDLVDGPVDLIHRDVEPLGKLQAPHGVYFVTGNHEYYSGPDEWITYIKSLSIRVLQNEHVTLTDPRSNAAFDLAGIFDKRGGWFASGHTPDIRKAVLNRDPNRALVVLAHQPSQIAHTAAVRPDLQISGHTHGGQIWPWTYAVRLAEPYVCGLYRHNAHTQVFVTRGVGYWGPPIRFLAPPEIPCLVLVS
jgi:hypothetical protein